MPKIVIPFTQSDFFFSKWVQKMTKKNGFQFLEIPFIVCTRALICKILKLQYTHSCKQTVNMCKSKAGFPFDNFFAANLLFIYSLNYMI